MEILVSYKRQLAVLAFFVLAASLIPIAHVYHAVGAGWQGVPPVYTDEDYFYARMKEVSDGHPLIGNPYLYEHRDDLAPTFFIPDWLAAIPLNLGASLPMALAVNFSLWSLIFAFLAFALLLEVRLHRNLAVLGAFLLYIQSYIWVLRPVSLQQVFPFFLLFMLAALYWYRAPERRGAKIFLAVAVAAPFYLYIYLWQVVVAALLLLAGVLCARRDGLRLKSLALPSALAFVLALPALIYTAMQIKHPFYWQMAERISLVYTHLPTAEVVYSGGWVVLTLLAFFLLSRWKRITDEDFSALVILSVIGIALVGVQASNIVTGKEVETAVHVKRFIVPWLGISLGALVVWLTRSISGGTRKPVLRSTVLVLIGVLGAANVYFAPNFVSFFASAARDVRVREIQTLAAPFHYLEAAEASPVVVWVTDPEGAFANYLPALTRHYVLYSHPGMWHLVSNNEIMERYLTANYLHPVTKESLIADLRAYAGPAAFAHRANTVNRGVKLCRLLQLERLGYSCGQPVTPEGLLGDAYFDDLIRENNTEIRPHIRELLTKYHVSYIATTEPFSPSLEQLFGTTLVYSDSHYSIYRL
ncbi:MAG: hypothetical protein Q8P36_00550 [bacterium]|nr:hypothetical protein [bacterium]